MEVVNIGEGTMIEFQEYLMGIFLRSSMVERDWRDLLTFRSPNFVT